MRSLRTVTFLGARLTTTRPVPILRTFAAPRRRRRGRAIESLDEQGDATSSFSLRHPPVNDVETFEAAANALLLKIYASMEKLLPINPDMALSRGVEPDVGPYLVIDLGVSTGLYNLQMDFENGVLLLSSPVSGDMTYVLSARTNEWVGDDDGHSFEGLLVRDLLRQIQGVPDL